MLVELHEGLHHELQSSTPWGLVCAVASALAAEGFRTSDLSDLTVRMIDASRLTHETFATVISGLAVGESETVELLLGNPLYSQYFDDGLALVARDSAPHSQLYCAAVSALLRVCMSPAGMFGLVERGFHHMHGDGVGSPQDSPDARLAAYRTLGGPSSWRDVFAELFDTHRARFRVEHERLPDEHSEEFADLRVLEEEILLPSCYRHAQRVLEQAGMESVPIGKQLQFTQALKSAVEQVDPAFGQRLRVVAERRSVAEDMLEFDRQQIVLRQRLPVSTEAFTGAPGQLAAYRVDDPVTPYACAIWVSRRAAAKQWDVSGMIEVPDTLVALVQSTAASNGDGASLAIFTGTPSPRQVQTFVGEELPVVALTTHSSLADQSLQALLSRVTPVFVVMDLPIAWHVNHWLDQGAAVRFAVSPLTGVPKAELWLAAFMLDTTPGMVFLNMGSSAAISLLSERIRARHNESLTVDPEVLQQNQTGINLAISHIFSLWSVLDQNGA
ncbi:hypothetical protein [Mycobacterium colombiense]